MPLTLEDYRRCYADEIRFVANLNSPALVEAFARVPREEFIGPGPWRVGSAEARALAAAGLGRAAYVAVDEPRHLYHNVVVIDESRDINNGQPSASLGAGLMIKIVRKSDRFSAQPLTPVGIYSCKSVRDPELEPLVRTAFTTQALLKVHSLRRDEHDQDATCVLHGKGVCFSSAELETN